MKGAWPECTSAYYPAMRSWLRVASLCLCLSLFVACADAEPADPTAGDETAPSAEPSVEDPTPDDTATDDDLETPDSDPGNSDAAKSMIDVSLAPIGLEPRGISSVDEPQIATDAFVANGGKLVVTQIWEGLNEPSGLTFISDIRFEFDSSQGATAFVDEAQAELTAFVTSLKSKKIKKRFTYIWATGHLVAFIVIGGTDSLEEANARQGAVLVEQRMETITDTDSNGDGEIGDPSG